MEQKPSIFNRVISWITGAKEGERTRVILTFLALFCLLVSYYLIKPLRNSKFLGEFHPSRLPFVYAGVAALSFVVTKVFSHIAQKVEKYRLVIGAYCVIIAGKLGLGLWLTVGGKVAVVCFYFFASVYFLLAVATLWACINDMFVPEQSERCFGFVTLGSTIGGIGGSKLSKWVANSAYSDYTLYFSIIFLAGALALVMLATRSYHANEPKVAAAEPAADEDEEEKEEKKPKKSSGGDFWSELRALATRPYIRRIAITVLLLAVATTAIEFVSQATIDRELAKSQYETHFSSYAETKFESVYALKTQSDSAREAFFKEVATAHSVSESEVEEAYESYRKALEIKTRSFFADTYFYQGIAGAFSLLIVARVLFSRVGMRYCFSILPVLALSAICLFGITVDLLLVQVVLILVGASNYSLNNAAKEILYTATDEETLFRFKPMIEGPCMRAGDVLASIIKLSIGAIAAAWALSTVSETNLFVGVTVLFLLVWIRAAWLAGKQYDEELR